MPSSTAMTARRWSSTSWWPSRTPGPSWAPSASAIRGTSPSRTSSEQRPQPRRGHAGLEVVEEHVVGVLGLREAVDVAVAELQVGGQRVAEAGVVGRRAGLLPGRLADGRGAAEVGGQRGGHAHRLLDVAAQRGDQADVVRVGVLLRRPRPQRVEQPAELRVAQLLVGERLQRRLVVAARGRAARRHHRVLVPEHQRLDPPEPGEQPRALVQGGELGRRGAVEALHRRARIGRSDRAIEASRSAKVRRQRCDGEDRPLLAVAEADGRALDLAGDRLRDEVGDAALAVDRGGQDDPGEHGPGAISA